MAGLMAFRGSFGGRLTLALVSLGTFVLAYIVVGTVVFWLFRVTGNWDSEGADIAIYPGLITIAAALAIAWATRRALARRQRSRPMN